ncbi:MAG: alpha/beta hydrolase [Acidobacteria bacterium]|nr:alpha/beta hydrolase [Acidobacteriota bacterium]MCI0718208.1 alpha/beta hydrolase [Acidobacteriota bacterium]
MAITGNTSLNRDRGSRWITGMLRLGFRLGGRVSPHTASQAALWLFTKPYRSPILPKEDALLAMARCYDLGHKNGTLAVMEWGEGPVILCVHGWSSRGLRFSPLIEVFADAGYRVVTFDAPAHGRSSGSHIDLMDYVDALMQVAGKVGPLHGIVAHSFGATATLLALEKGLTAEKAVFFSALNGLRGPLDYLAERLQMAPEVLQAVKGIFETKFNRSIESLEAVRIVPKLTTPPLLVFHDRDDPLLPYHNALDLTGVWKNSQLIGTLGTSHHSILDDPAAIRMTLSFFRTTKHQELA